MVHLGEEDLRGKVMGEKVMSLSLVGSGAGVPANLFICSYKGNASSPRIRIQTLIMQPSVQIRIETGHVRAICVGPRVPGARIKIPCP